MPFDDLDLEFEDEEEAKKKKSDAVAVDVDLEFAAPEGGQPRVRPGPAGAAKAAATAGPKTGTGAVVQKLDDARGARPQATAPRPAAVASSTRTAGSSALAMAPQFEGDAQEVVALREHVQKVEFEASVKVAVAEFKTELLSDLMSDIKLVDHQVGQMLARINAKHPDMKQEILMIKKILADFTAKKRK